MPTWSTGDVPARRQFSYWREMICEAFLDLTPESHHRDGFRGLVNQHPLGRLDLARIDSQAQRVRRTEADIARSPQSGFYANLQVRGVGVTTQDGRTTVTRPGDLTVIDTSRPFTFDFSDDFRQLSLHLPEAVLRDQTEAPIRTATRISTATGIGAAIRHALQAIDRDELRPESATRLASHASGLLAVALDQPEPVPPTVRRHGRLLDEALADVAEHLGDDDLSPTVTDHLEAALDSLAVRGRVVACGMISTYNDNAGGPAPRNLRVVVGKRLRILGMLVHDHADQRETFLRDMRMWLPAGDIRYRETVVSGLANAPAALVGLLQGDNIGKMLVTL
jgi:hypothetical protein